MKKPDRHNSGLVVKHTPECDIFEVFLDDRPSWHSEPVTLKTPPSCAKVPLENAKRLRLQVRNSREEASATRFFYPCFMEPIPLRN